MTSSVRGRYLFKTYGISEAQYKELLKKQGNACAVCQRGQETFPKNLAVDHDHVSGYIRGLLCTYCNRRLVGRHRDSEILRRVAEYIDQHTGWKVSSKKKKKRKRKKRASLK